MVVAMGTYPGPHLGLPPVSHEGGSATLRDFHPTHPRLSVFDALRKEAHMQVAPPSPPREPAFAVSPEQQTARLYVVSEDIQELKQAVKEMRLEFSAAMNTIQAQFTALDRQDAAGTAHRGQIEQRIKALEEATMQGRNYPVEIERGKLESKRLRKELKRVRKGQPPNTELAILQQQVKELQQAPAVRARSVQVNAAIWATIFGAITILNGIIFGVITVLK